MHSVSIFSDFELNFSCDIQGVLLHLYNVEDMLKLTLNGIEFELLLQEEALKKVKAGQSLTVSEINPSSSTYGAVQPSKWGVVEVKNNPEPNVQSPSNPFSRSPQQPQHQPHFSNTANIQQLQQSIGYSPGALGGAFAVKNNEAGVLKKSGNTNGYFDQNKFDHLTLKHKQKEGKKFESPYVNDQSFRNPFE